jgi:hypothetical protein
MAEAKPLKLKPDGSTKKVHEFETGDTLPTAVIPALSYLTNVVEDTTPQLGGNLDLNGNGLSANSNLKGLKQHLRVAVLKPSTLLGTNTVIPITITEGAITVTNVEARTSNASYQIAGDVKWADARIGLASATVINDFDTTSGVRSDSTITAGAVATGKFVYLQFDSAPDAALDDIFIQVTFVYS